MSTTMIKKIKIGNESRDIAAKYDYDGNLISTYAKSADVYAKTSTYNKEEVDGKFGSCAQTSALSEYAKTSEVDSKLTSYVLTEDLSGYVQTSTLTETLESYVTINSASLTYLSKEEAALTYVADSSLSTEYVKWDGESGANNTFLKIENAYDKNKLDSDFLTKSDAESTYLTQDDAAGIDGYLSKADANTDWLNKENVVTINGESLFGPGNLVIKADKEKVMEMRNEISSLMLGQDDLEGYTYLKLIIINSAVSSDGDVGKIEFNNIKLEMPSITHTFFSTGAVFEFYGNIAVLTNALGDRRVYVSEGDVLTFLGITSPSGMKLSFIIYKELVTIKTNGGEE